MTSFIVLAHNGMNDGADWQVVTGRTAEQDAKAIAERWHAQGWRFITIRSVGDIEKFVATDGRLV